MHQSNVARRESLLEWQSRPTAACATSLLNVCPIPERNQDIAAISLAATTEVRRKIGGVEGKVLVTSMNSRPKAKRYGRTVPDKSTRAENLLIFFSDTDEIVKSKRHLLYR